MSEMNAETVMELSDIRKTYREGKLKTEVLKGVSLSIPKGALMALVGASGSGKSTLLHIMGTLDRRSSAIRSLASSTSSTISSASSRLWRMS